MTAEFVYNADGLRVQKTVNGVATKYTLHGKNVVHMTSGTDELHFFYDAQNRPAVVVYNGTAYAYVKSLQGDIVAILDENGNTVVSYGYDAWGAPLWCTGELAETLGKVQPFRYRGYVFDEETGLYYLRSRYYSYQFCRFLNADSLLNRNLFLYCHNEPVRFVDINGKSEITIFQNKYSLLGPGRSSGAGVAASAGAVGLAFLLTWLSQWMSESTQGESQVQDNAASDTEDSEDVPLSERIDWKLKKSQYDHIVKGSDNHNNHDWFKFNIDPNDPNAWEKIIPLLKIVADNGEIWDNPNSTKPIANVVYYIYHFEEYATSLVLKLHEAQNGWYTISDAFPLR